VVEFVLNGGQPVKPAGTSEETPIETNGQAVKAITFEQFKKRYVETLAVGAIEENSLDTVKMHMRHLGRTLGEAFPLATLTLNNLQDHINRRVKAKGIRGRKLSATTIRKEIASFRAGWNWGMHAGLVHCAFPNKGLMYPKTNEKAPFQTWKEIEKQIQHLPEKEHQDLWDCLFLTMPELDELLKFVREHSIQPFLYPMCCFAAYTGARRSEMLRLQLADIDLDAGTARIHEKKRVHGKRTTRRIPLSPGLALVINEWLSVHPGGPFLFCQQQVVVHSKKKRTAATPITPDEAHDHLKRTFADGKWKIVRGWHLFRHTFISLCVMRGIDQRLIDSWVGHTTEEMRKRYTHLYPSAERQAIRSVFEDGTRACDAES
jgi:integrase